MQLTVYDVIKRPIMSDKANRLNKIRKQLMLEVHVKATKTMICEALRKLFNIKVDAVRTLNRKVIRSRSSKTRRGALPKIVVKKIAYVSLADGYTLNLLEQMNVSKSK